MNKNGIVGRGNLLKLFPNYKEDIAENGIDLRIKKVEQIDVNNDVIGCIDNIKIKPKYKEVKPYSNALMDINGERKIVNCYEFLPKQYYFITLDKTMHIPDGYTQTYYMRSSFARCGLSLVSAVGDNGYNGTLMMGLVNNNETTSVFAGVNERIVQCLVHYNDGTASSYDGDYQNDRIYKE